MKKMFLALLFLFIASFQLQASNGNVKITNTEQNSVIEQRTVTVEKAEEKQKKKALVIVSIYDAEAGEHIADCVGELMQTSDGYLIIVLIECWPVEEF